MVGPTRRRGRSGALGSHASARADLHLADADIQQALSWARESGDDLCLAYAYGARANLLLRTGALGELVLLQRQAQAHAVEHGRGAAESAVLADVLIYVGDLPAAAAVLREGLSSSGKTSASVSLRLHAAVVASRRGDRLVANMHRARAYELMPSLERRVGAFAATALADVLLAESEPGAAWRLLVESMSTATTDPGWADELLVWGARAAADLVEVGDDARDEDAVTTAREGLADLVSLRAALPGTAYEPRCDTDLVRPAMGALFEAERLRANGDGDLVVAWRGASMACERAGMRWDQQALWRLGAELVLREASYTEAAEVLRAAHRYALEQEAHSLLHRVKETATLGRMSLAEPEAPSRRDVRPAAFAQLTDREAEILSHLVASRTNAEIAAVLFISAKTVSVHVSNVMRKTSTGSRREVAALAIRLGWTPDADR